MCNRSDLFSQVFRFHGFADDFPLWTIRRHEGAQSVESTLLVLSEQHFGRIEPIAEIDAIDRMIELAGSLAKRVHRLMTMNCHGFDISVRRFYAGFLIGRVGREFA